MKKERTTIAVKDLDLNKGQLDWLGANPREGTREDVEQTMNSLLEDKDYLDDRPLLVLPIEGGKYITFCGNLRLTAAKALKWKDVPCVIYHPETPEDRQTVIRRMFKDNGTFGSWDAPAVDAFGISKEQLADWGVKDIDWGDPTEAGSAAPVEEDDFDETTDEIHVLCKPGDIWQLGEHRLMCGDSIDLQQVKALMGGGES